MEKMKKNTVFRINGDKYKGFVWDDCHKIYLLETQKDLRLAKIQGYDPLPMEDLPCVWRDTCPLRFINTFGTLKTIVPQFSGVEHIEVATRGHLFTTKL